MKVHRLTVMVVDFDELGAHGVTDVMENIKYPNWCIYPKVMESETVDVGEWDDDHPLNNGRTSGKEFRRLFKRDDPYDVLNAELESWSQLARLFHEKLESTR